MQDRVQLQFRANQLVRELGPVLDGERRKARANKKAELKRAAKSRRGVQAGTDLDSLTAAIGAGLAAVKEAFPEMRAESGPFGPCTCAQKRPTLPLH